MSALTDTEKVAVERLHALLELLPSELDRQMAPTGMTSFEFTLVEALHHADQHRLRLSALASQTNATLPRLSRVVSRLEKKGYVVRRPCEEDGRAINAVLTDAGRESFERSVTVHDAAIRRSVLSGLDAQTVQQLADVALAVLNVLSPDLARGASAGTSPKNDRSDELPQRVR
jgi:DNA-binding MarR family transcriptional regulator